MEILALLVIGFCVIFFADKIKLGLRHYQDKEIIEGWAPTEIMIKICKTYSGFLLLNFAVLVILNTIGGTIYFKAGLVETQIYYGILTGLAILETLTRKKTKFYKPII